MSHRPITSKDVASLPPPGFNLADSIQFSPDDTFLTYLRSPNQSLSRQLYAFNLQSQKEYLYVEPENGDGITEENLSMEEKLRREVGVSRGLDLCRSTLEDFFCFSSANGN